MVDLLVKECEYCKRHANWLLCEVHLKEKINKAKKQGAIDLLKKIKVMRRKFLDSKEADEFILSFLERKIKKELK